MQKGTCKPKESGPRASSIIVLGIDRVTALEAQNARRALYMVVHAVLGIGVHHTLLVLLGNGDNRAGLAMHGECQAGRNSRGPVRGADHLFAALVADRLNGAGRPRHHPVTLHLIPFRTGLVPAQ